MGQGNSQIIEIADTQVAGTPQVIEIADTQVAGNPPAPAMVEEDDDVILIPENIETIDLCTQIQPTPHIFRVPLRAGEVIEIEDSPMTQQQTGTTTRHGPTRRGRENTRTSPYQAQNSKSAAKRLDLDDSLEEGGTQAVKISCPICLDSVIGRQPASTICGHIFCKPCIVACIRASKKCPMCKKTLKATNIHDIYLGV
jgi:Ring finger domain